MQEALTSFLKLKITHIHITLSSSVFLISVLLLCSAMCPFHCIPASIRLKNFLNILLRFNVIYHECNHTQ